VVDPKQQIEELKKQQNATLKRIVVEERNAETAREATLRSVADPKERQNLESVSYAQSGDDYKSTTLTTFHFPCYDTLYRCFQKSGAAPRIALSRLHARTRRRCGRWC